MLPKLPEICSVESTVSQFLSDPHYLLKSLLEIMLILISKWDQEVLSKNQMLFYSARKGSPKQIEKT